LIGPSSIPPPQYCNTTFVFDRSSNFTDVENFRI
jgi:hypothetical protein